MRDPVCDVIYCTLSTTLRYGSYSFFDVLALPSVAPIRNPLLLDHPLG